MTNETSLPKVLSKEQIETFLKDGVLVVEGMLDSAQVEAGLSGMSATLAAAGVDSSDLPNTGHGLEKLSSTNGSGGVLDLFYDDWKCEIATNPKLFAATTELWEAAFCHKGEAREELEDGDVFRWHPYGAFDFRKGYCYVDRIGFRLPTELATTLGAELQRQAVSRKKKKSLAIQRSLTPHLDCCPQTFFSAHKTKWRPIQSFVSLSDTLEPNMGGFEAAKGFHKEFHKWDKIRPPTTKTIKKKVKVKGKVIVTETEVVAPAACIGEYTHLRPSEDSEVFKRVQHVKVPAGSAVFFDNRIPHANAYRHDGDAPRCVVYCSFLPDIPINQQYAAEQLLKWKRNEPPNDQWVGDGGHEAQPSKIEPGIYDSQWLNPLAKKLMKIDPW